MTYRNIGMLSHQEQEGSTNSNNMSNNSECKTRLLPYPHSNSHSKWRWTAGVQLHVSQPKIRWNLIARTASLQGFGRRFHSSCCAHEGMCEWSLCICIKTWIYHLTRHGRSGLYVGNAGPLRMKAVRNHLEVPVPFAGTYFPKHALNKNWDSTLGQICVLQCFADFQSSKISSHQSLHDLPTVSPLIFRKASALNALYLLEICKASSGSLVSRCFGGKCQFLLWGVRCLIWTKHIPWYHDGMHRSEYILISFGCSFVSDGHSNHSLIFFCSLFCSSQCTMELRCIDWYLNLPTRATWLQERHCCKQYYIHEFIQMKVL